MGRREPRLAGTPAAHAKQARCTKCGETKSIEMFVRDRTRISGRFPWCKECVIAARKDYAAHEQTAAYEVDGDRKCVVCLKSLGGAHFNRRFCSPLCKGRARRWGLFGLSPEEYRNLTASGRCPICQKRVRRWATDHNHETGETFGPVCSMCNQHLLAYTNHDPEIAARLLAFISNPPVRQLDGARRYSGPEGTSQLDRQWLWSEQNPDPENLSDAGLRRLEG